MANLEHLAILRQGVKVWNQWRTDNLIAEADLTGAGLSKADLRGAKLSRANLSLAALSEANLSQAGLFKADLSKANLRGANLRRAFLPEAYLFKADLTGAVLREAILLGADLTKANLSRANLNKAGLVGANLRMADLTGAVLTGADLSQASLVETNLSGADISGCNVYGISAWDLKLSEAIQRDLVITPDGVPAITVDDLRVAQFIYLLLDNEQIRDVIDTITSKAVLILGNFSDEHKAALDAIKNELRQRNYLPILIDFKGPSSKDTTGTVETLARMSRFVIADVTDPSSIPHELATVVPYLRTTPVRLLRLQGSSGYSMVKDLIAYPWVLEIYEYEDTHQLMASLSEHVIGPAELKVAELRGEK